MVELPVCKFDGYPCYRNLCCYSRFFSGRCPRFVVVVGKRVTPRKANV